MKKLRYLAIALFWVIAKPATAEVLTVTDGWVREPIPGQSVTVGYLQLTNNSSNRNCEITVVTSDVAERVEIHEHLHSQGKMQMRQVPSLVINAQTTRNFQPGGLHLMLLDLKTPISIGDEVTLMFDAGDCGVITSQFPVKGLQ